MRLNLYPQLLQMLNDGTVDSATQVGVLVCDCTRLVAYAVEDVLRKRSNLVQPQHILARRT